MKKPIRIAGLGLATALMTVGMSGASEMPVFYAACLSAGVAIFAMIIWSIVEE